MTTRSNRMFRPAAEEEEDDVTRLARGRQKSRQRTVEEAAEAEDLARGRTRAGKIFTRKSRGHYDDIASLKKAHKKLFSLEPSLYLVERPVSGRASGLAEAVLRVNDKSTDIRKSLERAAVALFRIYPGATLLCQITANIILTKDKSYSIYYGQRYSSNGKEVNYGQEFDEEGGVTKKATFYELNAPTDVYKLPLKFSSEYFGELFKKNFGTSSAKVHSVVNLIYKFSKGMESYEEEMTTGQKWVSLF